MKKFLIPMLLVFMAVVLSGCSDKEKAYIPENTKTAVEEVQQAPVEELTEETIEKTDMEQTANSEVN